MTLTSSYFWVFTENYYGLGRTYGGPPPADLILWLTRWDGEEFAKIMLVAIISLSGFAMYLLGREVGSGNKISFATGLLYMTAPMLFNRISAGHLFGHAVAYAVIPLVLTSFSRLLKSNSAAHGLAYMTLVSIFLSLGTMEPHYLVIDAILLYSICLLNKDKKFSVKIAALVLTLLLGVLFSPSYVQRLTSFGETLSAVAPLAAGRTLMLNTGLLDSAMLLGWIADYFAHGITMLSLHSWYLSSLLLVLMLLSCPLVFRKNRVYAGFLSMVFVAITVLSSPGAVALAFISFLYDLLGPGGRFFTEVYHFMALPTFLICIGFALFAQTLRIRLTGRVRRKAITAFLVLLVASFVSPTFVLPTFVLEKTWSQYTLPAEYARAYSQLSGDDGIYRVLWLPESLWPYGMGMAGVSSTGRDPVEWYSPKPSVPQMYQFGIADRTSITGDVAVSRTSITLSEGLGGIGTGYVGSFLALSSVKYLFYRSDVRTYEWGGDLSNYEKGLSTLYYQMDLTHVRTDGVLDTFQNRRYLPIIYEAGRAESFLVAGDLSTTIPLTYFASEGGDTVQPKLFLFASQLDHNELMKALRNADNVVISSGGFYDLIYPLIPSNARINARDFAPIEMGWWQGMADWQVNSALETPPYRPSDWQDGMLNLKFTSDHEGYYSIYAKVLFSSGPKPMIFNLDGLNITVPVNAYAGNISDTSTVTDRPMEFRWTEIGASPLWPGVHNLTVVVSPGTSVSRLMVTDRKQMDSAFNLLQNELSGKTLYLVNEAEAPSVTFSTGWNLTRQNFNASRGFAVKSAGSPEPISYKLWVPASSHFHLMTRLAGSDGGDDLNMAFSGNGISLRGHPMCAAHVKAFQWCSLDLGTLSAGSYSVAISSAKSGIVLDTLLLRSDPSPSPPCDLSLEVRKMNPTLYHISSPSDCPHFLVVNLNRSPAWSLHSEGTSGKPLIANGYGQAYFSEGGKEHIELQYTPQQVWFKAFAIAFAILVAVLSALMMITVRSKLTTAA